MNRAGWWMVAVVPLSIVLGASGVAGSGQAGYTPADVRFMQGMIAHHAQALAMTSLVPSRTTHPDIRLLAQRISISQRDEIHLMQSWLSDRHQHVPNADTLVSQQSAGRDMAMPGMTMSDSDHVLMPGMLTPAQMSRLAASTGAQFDSLFLHGMIGHHEGALTMVAQLLNTQGAAQDPSVFQFASDVDAVQRAQIARMQAMLAANPATAAPSHY